MRHMLSFLLPRPDDKAPSATRCNTGKKKEERREKKKEESRKARKANSQGLATLSRDEFSIDEETTIKLARLDRAFGEGEFDLWGRHLVVWKVKEGMCYGCGLGS